MTIYHAASGSVAEDLFIELFSDTFGAEKAGYLYSQYHFYDIYQNSRYADFVLENGPRRIAIEIDDEESHNRQIVSSGKFYDDLLKQNSMIHLGWDVYRWAVRQMQKTPDTVKDELRVFLGNDPRFKEIEDYLPTQRGKALDGGKLELREYQLEALASLSAMRENKETLILNLQSENNKQKEQISKLEEEIAKNLILDVLAGQMSPLYKELLDDGLINGNFSTEYFNGYNYAAPMFSGESNDPESVASRIKDAVKNLKETLISQEDFETVRKKQYGKTVRAFADIDTVANADGYQVQVYNVSTG